MNIRVWALGLAVLSGPGVALSLEEAMREAATAQPALHAYALEQEAALALAESETGLPAPEFSLRLQSLPLTGEDAFDLRADDMTMLALGIEQPLPSSDLRDASAAVAKGDAALSQARGQALARERAQRAGLAWVDWRLALLQRELLSAELAALDEADAQAQVAARSSETGLIRVLELRIEKAELTSLAARWRGVAASAEQRLEALLGRAAQSDPQSWPQLPDPDCAALEADLAQHPEQLAASARSRMAESEHRLRHAQNRPQWNLMAGYGLRGGGRADMLEIGVSLRFDALAGQRSSLQLSASSAMWHAAEAREVEQLRALRGRLRASCQALDAASEELRELRSELRAAAASHAELARLRYAAGSATLASALDAARMHWRHEREIAEVTARYWRERVRLRSFESLEVQL